RGALGTIRMNVFADPRAAIAALWLASCLAGCSQQHDHSWTTTTVDGRFSFQMPSHPKVEPQKQDTPTGEVSFTLYRLQLENPTQTYAFGNVDLPAVLNEPKGEEIEEKLDGVQQGSVANVKGKVLKSDKIKVAGFAGRDLLIQLPNANIERVRGVLVHRTLIMMEVYNVNSKDADRFFDSLKLLKESPETAAASPRKP
ncbi:MAG TPA: hypothetical protein VHY20_09740, partial [Pirellulales bacterium]|nr:hypothetical protein [Pirellulales bacterium]